MRNIRTPEGSASRGKTTASLRPLIKKFFVFQYRYLYDYQNIRQLNFFYLNPHIKNQGSRFRSENDILPLSRHVFFQLLSWQFFCLKSSLFCIYFTFIIPLFYFSFPFLPFSSTFSPFFSSLFSSFFRQITPAGFPPPPRGRCYPIYRPLIGTEIFDHTNS